MAGVNLSSCSIAIKKSHTDISFSLLKRAPVDLPWQSYEVHLRSFYNWNDRMKLKQNGIFNLIGGGLFFLVAILTVISFEPTFLYIAGCILIGILMIATGFERQK